MHVVSHRDAPSLDYKQALKGTVNGYSELDVMALPKRVTAIKYLNISTTNTWPSNNKGY